MDVQNTKSDVSNSPDQFWVEQRAPEALHEFFVFELDGELYAVLVSDILQVIKIPPITPVPNAPRAIAGIFHSRGKVIVVVDLLVRLALARTTANLPGYVFILARQENYFGILVDQTKMVMRVSETAIQEASSVMLSHIAPRYVKGVFFYNDDEVHHPIRIPREDFMIKPKTEGGTESKEVKKTRPVLWLNIPVLLDETDLRTMMLSPDATASPEE